MKTKLSQEELNEVIRLHGLWLRGDVGGIRADLEGANLEGANLWGANLWGSDLEGANLRGANLEDANLQGSNLRGSNLRGSNLEDANLQGSDLQGANLRGANLRGANLWGANLEGSDGGCTKIKSAMGWIGLYRYWVFVAITESGTFIRMGCHWRTLQEWESDFWNNLKEFPNDGSAKSNMRLAAFNYAKEWIKNNS